MVDDSLIGRLQSNQANYLKIKQVEIENNGQTDTYLFFYLSEQNGTTLLRMMMYSPSMSYALPIRAQNTLIACFTIQGTIPG